MKPTLSLSIVIPVYNEARRLSKTFAGLNELQNFGFFKDLEIVFADDGSRDETKKLIGQFIFPHPVKIISYEKNRGKGFAVRSGMLKATGDYALMMDADISTPISEIKKFLPFMEAGIPVIIGNRKMPEAQMIPPQPFLRRKLGEGYTFFARFITGVKVSDFTCGFKCFSKEARKRIFQAVTTERWSYDAEILYLAKKIGFKIKEVPVIWRNDRDTKVRLRQDIWRSFLDLLKIRFKGKQDL